MKEIPITFTNNRQQLVGIFHTPKATKNALKPPRPPLIILLHGWSGNRLGTWNAFFVKAAREFCKSGYAVLRFDFRGSGDSEGKFEDQTITSMLEDLQAVIDQTVKFQDIDIHKICLIGHSQGAYVSFLQALNDKRIKSVISWMGRLSNLNDFWSKTWAEELKRKGYIIVKDYIINKNCFLDNLQYDLPSIIPSLRIPSLFVYGDQDVIVPPSEGLKIYNLLKSPKKLTVLSDLDHTFTGEAVKKKIINLTLDWLKKNLK